MRFFVVLNSGWEANIYIYECAATVLVNHWSIVICDSHKMPSPFGHQFLTTANDREKKRSEHKQDNKTEFEWSYMFDVKWHKVFIHVRILFVRCFCSVAFVPFRFFLFLAQSVFFSSSAFATIYISWMFLALMLMPFVSISIMDGWFCFNKKETITRGKRERRVKNWANVCVLSFRHFCLIFYHNIFSMHQQNEQKITVFYIGNVFIQYYSDVYRPIRQTFKLNLNKTRVEICVQW